MKMLTLWACMETSGEAAPATALDTTLAWKQAWKAVDPATTNPASQPSPSTLPCTRETADGPDSTRAACCSQVLNPHL